MSDIICKIVAGEIPCAKVYENEDVIAFKDINPMAPIHIPVSYTHLDVYKRQVPALCFSIRFHKILPVRRPRRTLPAYVIRPFLINHYLFFIIYPKNSPRQQEFRREALTNGCGADIIKAKQ